VLHKDVAILLMTERITIRNGQFSWWSTAGFPFRPLAVYRVNKLLHSGKAKVQCVAKISHRRLAF